MRITTSHRLATAHQPRHPSLLALVVQTFSLVWRPRCQQYHDRRITMALAQAGDCPYHPPQIRFRTQIAVPIHHQCTSVPLPLVLHQLSHRTTVFSAALQAQFSRTADATQIWISSTEEGRGTLAPIQAILSGQRQVAYLTIRHRMISDQQCLISQLLVKSQGFQASKALIMPHHPVDDSSPAR